MKAIKKILLSISGFVLLSINITFSDSLSSVEIKMNREPIEAEEYILLLNGNKEPSFFTQFFQKTFQTGPGTHRRFFDFDVEKYDNKVSIRLMKISHNWPVVNDVCVSSIVRFNIEKGKTILKEINFSNATLKNSPNSAAIMNNSDAVTLYVDYNIDHDSDGLGATQELAYATDDFNPDTDYDNLNDYWDALGTNIILNLDEQPPITINTAATDPLNPDSDNDGVLDGVEVYGLAPYGFVTDPNNPDTDGDGVLDGQDSNPLGITDENGDGVADEWVEFWQNQISQWDYSSSWLTSIENPNADTDGDGISNRDEYENGTVPIVPNGHYETRILPSPLEISANVDEIVTAEFNVVDLSFQPSTGEVFQLHQPWAESIHVVPENLKLKYLSTNEWYQENLPARFCSLFGIQNKFQFAINTTNLATNTTYKDKIIIVTGGITNECEVRLLIGSSPANNHAPTIGRLIFPSDKSAIKNVDNVQLNWTAATDDDSGDTITYEVRCSAFHFTGAPATMAADVNQTTIQAVGWEEGLNDKLEYQRKYEWQIVARDHSGATAFSPIWSFVTLPSNYVDVIILSDNLRKGYIGRSYKEQLIAAYGFPPYKWQILSGNLPAGLLLRTDGTICGKPISTGNYNFEVETEDWAGGKTNTAINLEIGITGSGNAGCAGNGNAGHGSF